MVVRMRVRDELQPDNHGLEEVGDTRQGVRVVAGPHPLARQHKVGSPRQTVQHQRRSVHYDSTARQLLNQEGDEYRQHPRDDREHRPPGRAERPHHRRRRATPG